MQSINEANLETEIEAEYDAIEVNSHVNNQDDEFFS